MRTAIAVRDGVEAAEAPYTASVNAAPSEASPARCRPTNVFMLEKW